MKNRRKFSYLSAITFFLLIAATVTVAMFLYHFVNKSSNGDRTVISIALFLCIIFLSALCTVVDLFRTRFTVKRQVERILEATQRIASGDFSVRLYPKHSPEKYTTYDEIMANLNTMAEELGKSEVLKTDFISNVSHELKTPLAVIGNYAKLLAKADLDGETRVKYAKAVEDASKRLNDLVRNILKLNKLENQKVILEKQVFRLDESLAEILLSFEETIEQKNLQIDVSLEEIKVFSVAGYLEIVWSNLISNAIKFTNDGGRVALTLKKDGGNAVVCVKDSGCGISSSEGKRIFDKFYQGDTSHAQEGNGLGLALVKKAIDVLGGEISVQSEEGKGSTFTVVLKDIMV